MNWLLPRLTRSAVDGLLDDLLDLRIDEIARAMPVRGLPVTYAPVGGMPAPTDALDALRDGVVSLASANGYPHSRQQSDLQAFDVACARLLYEKLQITPHEASHREVWGCVTAGRLLDVAVWRWGSIRDRARVNGDLNRDTFRRLWWRAHVLQDPEEPWGGFEGLGEDEIVAIVERPVVTGNPEVARAIARAFNERLAEEPHLASRRMQLMRDAMKRLTRLTPFMVLDTLGRSEIDRIIGGVMRDAATALTMPEVASAGSGTTVD